MKKAFFYDPYLDSLGGGERYVLTLVEFLKHQGWQTALAWDKQSITEAVKQKFGLDIATTSYLPNLFTQDSLIKRISMMRQFDLVFFLSDGSVPLLAGKKNIVHFQVPFHDVEGRSLENQIKKHTIHDFVVNSEFTKRFVDQEYGIQSQVIYPPVDIDQFKPLKKEKTILYAARFSNLLQQKGHKVVLDAFKSLYDSGVKDYQLYIVGSTEMGTQDLIAQLQYEAKGYPVTISPNLSLIELRQLYGKAQFFWSAAGYEIDEGKEPEKCEHFGITLVEAMAAGCIPFAPRKGGYKEIIEEHVNGFFWNQTDELVNRTRALLYQHSDLSQIRAQSMSRAQAFSKKEFIEKFARILGL